MSSLLNSVRRGFEPECLESGRLRKERNANEVRFRAFSAHFRPHWKGNATLRVAGCTISSHFRLRSR